VELTREEDWCALTLLCSALHRGLLISAYAASSMLPCLLWCRAALLKLEEEYIERQCQEIAKHMPDMVVTEKGLSDLAMHFLTKAGISAIRRLRKTDNNRIARATGATIVHR